MKISVITNTDAGKFEKDVNELLKSVHVVDIKLNSSMYETEMNLYNTFTAIVAYEEYK